MRVTSAGDAPPKMLVYSSSEGRRRFPNILQASHAEKAIIGVGRHGRILGAIVPIEAISILAGDLAAVDPRVRMKVMRAARRLLRHIGGGLEEDGCAEAQPDEQKQFHVSPHGAT